MTYAAEPNIVVIGGGLAGISAALPLAVRKLKVLLLEARPQLGGRATTYTDPVTGQRVDNCQHVSMGCCTNLADLCTQLGVRQSFRVLKQLEFVDRPGRVTVLRETPLPAPLHLLFSFLKLPYLSLFEKWQFAWGIRKLARMPREQLRGVCFEDWLKEQGQSENLRRNAWELVLISALSEPLARVDAAYAQKVFFDGFLANRAGWRVEIPDISLADLYSTRTCQRLQELGVEVQLGARVQQLDIENGRVHSVRLKDGREVQGSQYVLAVPHHQVQHLLPNVSDPVIEQLDNLESAPITSVHLWFDRKLMELQQAVLVGRLSQWVFARPSEHADEFAYQVVISASRMLKSITHDGVKETHPVVEHVVEELRALFPEASAAKLIRSRMITEQRAVFSATPGVDRFRPLQQSPYHNLQFAGDWTQTGWPATMEGAVRSGYLAAENVLRQLGVQGEGILQPDLPVSFWCRWLLGRGG